MLAHLRSNLIAYVALFVALGGTSYAALSKNSVGSREIKPRAVKAGDLATGAVQSRILKDGSVQAQDLAPGVGVTGPSGPPGPEGAQGVAGERGERGERGLVGPTEGKSVDGPGSTPANPIGGDADTIATTRAGRLLVAKTVSSAQMNCASNSQWRMWAKVDGVRVPGSDIQLITDNTAVRATLIGVTATVVPAGSHTVGFDAACNTPTLPGDSLSTTSGDASVVVLGE